MTGGRELSRQQLSHFNESLFSRIEDVSPSLGVVTTEPSHEQSHADGDLDLDE